MTSCESVKSSARVTCAQSHASAASARAPGRRRRREGSGARGCRAGSGPRAPLREPGGPSRSPVCAIDQIRLIASQLPSSGNEHEENAAGGRLPRISALARRHAAIRRRDPTATSRLATEKRVVPGARHPGSPGTFSPVRWTGAPLLGDSGPGTAVAASSSADSPGASRAGQRPARTWPPAAGAGSAERAWRPAWSLRLPNIRLGVAD